ncbi:uncharacterized protein LOC143190686 isoform X1 [Rhynchophorus ferrugineus]|uniref:uncharacterized protein LOC143190686 isoform X1 n=1 Tax=Rhynchophorus ferrugineus TaxID=354439 RepID=UPI003FCED33A
MKLFYGLVIFCVVSKISCLDLHHVEGRNLEDEFEENIATAVPNEIIENTTIGRDGHLPGLPINPTSIVIVTSEPTPESTTKFNVSSLLREQSKPETYLTQSENENQKNEKPSNKKIHLIDTEVPGLLIPTGIRLHQQPLEIHSPVDIPDKVNDDTELIENGQNTEDELRKHNDMLTEEMIPQQRYLAVIVACTLTIVAILCYVSLWSWRRYLERRYGSRTMLVNAEEFDDPNDIHNFTI